MINTIMGLSPAIIYVLLMVVIGWIAYKLTNWVMEFNFRIDDEDLSDIE